MKWLVKVIFKAVKLLINFICLPIDGLINTLLPDLTTGISYVNAFFDWVFTFIRFILSWLPFSNEFYLFLIGALVFYYTIPMVTHTIKLVIKWYNALKP